MRLKPALYVGFVVVAMSGAAARPAVADGWPAQVSALLQKAHRLDRSGDLPGARNATLRAWLLYASTIETRIPADGEPPEYDYLFPQGEAMRLFDWNRRTRLVYVEVRGNSFAVTWKAHLVRAEDALREYGIKGEGASLPFANGSGYIIAQEWGHRPPRTMALAYYEYSPTVAQLSYFLITSAGGEEAGNGLALDRPGLYQTVLLPYYQPTPLEVQKEPQHEGFELMYGLGGRFISNSRKSRYGYGHIAWKFPILPAIPGEAGSNQGAAATPGH